MRIALNRMSYYARVAYNCWVKGRTEVPYLPEYVSLELTNVCNFKCAFCPQSNPNHLAALGRSYLKPDQAELLLGKIRAAGITTRLLHWTLDGEPFMNREFHKVCAVACRHGFDDMFFATNGTLASPRRMSQFPAEARYTLKIDYCADPVYFESVRGTPRSWQRIRDNIIALITDDRFSNVRVLFTDISPFGFQDRAELATRFQALKALFPKSNRVSFATKTFHNATGYLGTPGPRRAGRYVRCPYPWATLHVASNGDVVACSRDLEHKTVLGNLLRQPLPEIWNGEPMQALRRNLRDRHPERSAACANCDLPYDGSKYTVRNLINTAAGRLQLFAGGGWDPAPAPPRPPRKAT
jgi:radical SAM protein with 4Fe4S-binding SPASM domain